MNEFNLSMEKAVLSGLMQFKSAREASYYVNSVSVSDFYNEQHKIIFQNMLELNCNGLTIDIVTLVNTMKENGSLAKVGGSNTIMEIGGIEYTTINLPQHIAILRETAKKREILRNLDLASKDIQKSGKPADECISLAIEAFKKLPADYVATEKDVYKKQYSSNRIAGLLENAENNTRNCAISTGFMEIDNILGGGLYPGLYVVGAVSSLGKTSFVLNVCDNIAKNGHDVVIFSLEMAAEELMAKSISRETFELCNRRYGKGNYNKAKDTRDILAGNRWQKFDETDTEVIFDATAKYDEYAKRIMIIEGIGDIGVKELRASLEKHIELTGNRPVVMVDYLQILAPYNDRATDKQNNDKAILELKKMSRDFAIPIIVISSFNRENYTKPVNLAAYKEAGSIEYSADVAIALQYEGMDNKKEKAEERVERIFKLIEYNTAAKQAGRSQRIQVKVLKNRNGVTSSAVLLFWPKYNYFENDSYTSLGQVVEQEEIRWND